MTGAAPFDARPLTDPVRPADVRAWRRQAQAGSRVDAFALAFLIVFAVLFVLVFSVVVGGILSSLGDGSMLFLLFAAVILAAVVVLGILGARAWLTPTRAYRLARFAEANGMRYQSSVHAPALPGMVFRQGSNRTATDLVHGDHPRFIEFGNYRYETGTDKERQTHRWGYIAIRLDVPLPNIVLDARSNNTFLGSNLPEQFSRHQRLSLEGDFDRHFTLYAPRGYERDALYLFTPDIMARFIDHAAALDVEIVDDWLFLYAQRDLVTLDPAQWTWEFSVVGALLDKLAQWGRWRDERLAPGSAAGQDAASTPVAAAAPFAVPGHQVPPPAPIGVALGGRRLRRQAPTLALVVVGIVVLGWLVLQWGNIATVFSGFGTSGP